jgi:DNA-binding NtrC family response regulator
MKKVILVIDDDKDIRDMLSVSLASSGYDVRASDSLLAGLEVLNEICSSAACMLLDYNLPGMPMDDFLAKVKSTCPTIGIVVISAVDHAEEKAKKHGIPHFIQKPLVLDTLRKTINDAIEIAKG